MGYLSGKTLVPSTQSANSASSTLPLDLRIWHLRCSHVNYNDLGSAVSNQPVAELTLHSNSEPDPICEPCLAGKLHRHNIPRSASRKFGHLFLLHTDLKGPLPVATPEGRRYWMTFIDDDSRYWAVTFLKRKSDALDTFKAYKVYAETALGLRIKATRDDKGGEYIGHEYDAFCRQHGIQRQHTEPDETHQNGVAERANRTIAEGATALLVQSKLPPSFWGYGVSAFVHTRNCMPTASVDDAVPYTRWKGNGKKPDISYFRVFGCLAYVLVRKRDRKALQPHSRKYIFVGYPDGTKAYKFWDPVVQKFYISSHAVLTSAASLAIPSQLMYLGFPWKTLTCLCQNLCSASLPVSPASSPRSYGMVPLFPFYCIHSTTF